MPKGRRKFKHSWLKDGEHIGWIGRGSDIYHAKCILCRTEIDISGGSISHLKSHANGKKHKELIKMEDPLILSGTNTVVWILLLFLITGFY